MNKYNIQPIRYEVVMTYCYRHLTAKDRVAIMMMRTTHSIRAITVI